MFDMFAAELFKLRKRSMTWILLIILVAYFCLIFLATYGITVNPPESMPQWVAEKIRSSLLFPDAFDLIFSTASTIGALLMIILVASSIGSEYSWGSIRQVLAKRGIRYHFVVSKLFSFITISFIGLIISVIIGFILAIITSSLLEVSINWDFMTASYVGGLFANFGWTMFSLFPYILLATFFTFLGRSAIAGIGGGLGFYFIEAIAVSLFNQGGGWLAEIPKFLIGPNVDALIPSSIFTQGPFASIGTPPSTLHALLVLSVYCIVFLIISLYLFNKRDVTA